MNKEMLKEDAKKICGMMILFLISEVILYVIFTSIFEALNLNSVLVEYLTSIVAISSATLYFVKRYQKKWQVKITYQCKEDFTKNKLLKYMIIGLGVSFLISILINLLILGLQDVVVFETPDFNAKYGLVENIFIIIFSIVIAPIMEELLYRGLILKKLSGYGKWYAMIIVSILFGLMHGNIPQTIGAFMVSLVLCMVTLESGSLIPAIIIHSLNNLLAQLSGSNNEGLQIVLTIFILVVIVIALWLVVKELKKETSMHLDFKISDFFKNIWGIVFLVYTLLTIISMIKLK